MNISQPKTYTITNPDKANMQLKSAKNLLQWIELGSLSYNFSQIKRGIRPTVHKFKALSY